MVLAPAIFNFMIAMQTSIITTIPNIIFGQQEQANVDDTSMNMAFTVLTSFIKENKADGNVGVGVGKDIHDLESFRDHAADGCGGGFLGDVKNCKYDYMILISTICGGFLCWVLMSMTLDVAIRTIKLGIIQILAPIPISSYVFSKDRLNKFVKTTLTVYFDLFIRLAVIYFIIFAVQLIIDSHMLREISGEGWFKKAIANIALIGGLFMFAKNAPKFITDLLGLPDVGTGDMKDMFKAPWQRAGGAGIIPGMGGAAIANAKNRASFLTPGKTFGQKLKNAAKIAGSATAGAASAGFHGSLAAAQGKGLQDVKKAGFKRAIQARQNRDLDRLNGLSGIKGAGQRARAKLLDTMGIDTKESLAEGKQKAYSTLHSDVGAYKKAVMGRIIKNADVSMRTDLEEGSALDRLGGLLHNNMAAIKASGNADLMNFANKFERQTYTDKNGKTHTAYALKAGQSISYHDIAAINADATQTGIGSIAGVTGENGALTLQAQKELFTDAMHDRVKTTSGKLMDEINVHSNKTHVDISTVVEAAKQHLAENAVQLGESAESLQNWFTGTTSDSTSEHYGKDFNNMDDSFQKKSAELSGEMATSQLAAARASNQRRDSNKKENK